MSAEVLRRAAEAMRLAAAEATPGPWTVEKMGLSHVRAGITALGEPVAKVYANRDHTVADTVHIASWHPAVALAVADWLDATAAENDSPDDSALGFLNFVGADAQAALTLARAYLGADA